MRIDIPLLRRLGIIPIMALLVINSNISRAQGDLFISEILFQADVNNDINQFVEIRGTASNSISNGTYLVAIDGSSANAGEITTIFDLSTSTTGASIGSNGYLVLLQQSTPYTSNGSATTLTSSGTGFSGFAFFSTDAGDIIPSGPVTFALLNTSTPPNLTDDIDGDNDGVPDGTVFAGWTLLDGLSVESSGSDISYAPSVFDAGGTSEPGATRIDIDGNSPGYVLRSDENSSFGPASWLGAQVNSNLVLRNGLPTNFASFINDLDLNGGDGTVGSENFFQFDFDDNLTVSPGGDVNPGDNLQYDYTLTNTGTEDITDINALFNPDNVSLGGVKTTPLALDDSYETIGNFELVVSAGNGLLINDHDDGSITVVAGSGATGGGGTVAILADGSFTYTPSVGFRGLDAFTYTINDTDPSNDGLAVSSRSARVVINIDQMVWFVDNSAGGGNDGTFPDPFQSMNDFNMSSSPQEGDIVYVKENGGGLYENGITLMDYQQLIGSGVALVVDGTEYVPVGTDPTFVNTMGTNSGNIVNLGLNNTIRGLQIGDPGTSSGIAITGSGFGSLTIDNVTIDSDGQGFDLLNGDLDVTLNSFASLNSGSQGIVLDNVTGNLTVPSTDITDPQSDGLAILNSNATFNFGSTTISGAGQSGGDGVSLSTNAGSTITFSSLDVASDDGKGLLINNGGTVNISGGANTISATNDVALDLTNVSAGNWTFSSLTSMSSGSRGISLNNATGIITINGGSITGNSNEALVINGGSVNFTFDGDITHSAAAQAAIDIQDHSSGTVTFQTGTISATDGTGIQFDNADGIYNFNGTTTLNGGDAGIDILNGSGGSFTFGTGSSITSPTGTSFYLDGGTASVVFSGDITHATASQSAIVLTGHSGGTVIFQTGAISVTDGNGITLNNLTGTYNFNGPTSLNGGNAGIDVTNSGGSVAFGTGASITNPTGIAFDVDGGAGSVTYSGSISNNVLGGIRVTNRTGGAVLFQTGALNDTGSGFLFLDNTGGATTTFTNSGITLNTGTLSALFCSNGGAVSFAGGSLDIDATSGAGLRVINGGSITVSGTGNTITTTTGRAVEIDGASILTGVTFESISCNGATKGITLNNGGSAPFTVTGDGTGAVNGSGGLIQNTTGRGIDISATSNVSISQLDVTNAAQQGIVVVNSSGFTYEDAAVSGSSLQQSITFSNHSGLATLQNLFFTNIGEGAINIDNIGSTATFMIDQIDVQGHLAGSGLGDGVRAVLTGGTLDLTVTNSLFAINVEGEFGVQAVVTSGGVMDLNISSNIFNDAVGGGGGGISTSLDGTGTVIISGNMINNSDGTGITYSQQAASSCDLTISNNQILGASTAPGISIFDLDGTDLTTLVDNNTITGHTISINVSSGFLVSTATESTITNNTGDDNLVVTAGPIPGIPGTVCSNITGNNFTNGIDLTNSATTTFNVPQVSIPAISVANSGNTVNIPGSALTFSQPVCTTP